MKSQNAKQGMIIEKFPALFLFGLLAFVAWNLVEVIRPFLMVILFSVVVASVTYPIYEHFSRIFKHKKDRLASLITCLVVIFAILIPLLIFLLILARQAVDLYVMTNQFIAKVDLNGLLSWKPGNFFYDVLGDYRGQVHDLVQQNAQNLTQSLADLAKYISTYAATISAKVLTSLGVTLFNLFLIFFTLYFLYKDGDKLVKKIMLISPIPLKYEKELISKFREISRATLIGTFLTAVAQGFVALIGFSVAGVPNAFFWSTAVSIFSLVPVVGTGLIWFPMGLFLLLSGNVFGGVFVLLWGFFLISTVDNLLRVIFIGAQSNLNPLLTFITVFGGILTMGLIGVILGPMLMVLFLTLLHIYEQEYAQVLEN